ncbi:TetR/AcrR family transcriptional regulator [Mediterranea massiliensis]|uniref:TetR/AcrR family transcriptional regulator n=1 Tax=Mediterranea massiliensis TaxID=1841865 RepID=A0ABS2DZ71_9BACT|nr:TetR/AcrR family transcriptional regulator [Mediterranea massiliensis]MBM6734670.1 TetR/AcrR family transcriptional regulator [Mediterranea massiliensis]
MSENTKRSTSRVELKERIIERAMQAFKTHGIKCITMDDIAASMGISKRTLYEVFANKEMLLEDCIRKERQETNEYIRTILGQSAHVLEVLLKLYLRSIEKFHTTHKSFFEDIKKYPKAYELLKNDKNRDSAEVVNFFKEGVKQGIFRDDINFAIVNLLVHEQLDLLINSNICEKYSFLDVYESIMFTYLRGISTEKGAQELENFIREYRTSVRK